MAFFEDLGKKISKSSQGVMQKTKDTAEIINLNSAISEEKKKIAKLYSQIGEKYYELHAQNAETDLETFVSEVTQAKTKIEECSEKIRKLKGVINCPKCNKEIKYGTQFCSFCGEKIELPKEAEEEQPKGKVCVSCGASIEEGHMFCINCGTKVEEQPMQEQSSVKEEPENNKKICPNCKNENSDDCSFCISCGTKLEG